MSHLIRGSGATETRHSCYSPFTVAEAKLWVIDQHKGVDMTTHEVVSKGEWVEARKRLLAKEKEFTRMRDQLAGR